MPDSVTIIARGRTDMLVQSRAGVTEIRLPIVAPTVSMEIVGGAPGPRGLKGDNGLRGPAGADSGFGWIDYSDLDIGSDTALPAGTPVQVNRMLSASVANNRLLGPWENFVFWDATNHLIRARALYDMVAMSFVLRFRASVLGGKMEIALVIGVGKVAAKTLTLTAAVGAEENQRVDFFLPQRTSWFANGAAVVLTSSVDAELIEFSPEFYPQGFAP